MVMEVNGGVMMDSLPWPHIIGSQILSFPLRLIMPAVAVAIPKQHVPYLHSAPHLTLELRLTSRSLTWRRIVSEGLNESHRGTEAEQMISAAQRHFS